MKTTLGLAAILGLAVLGLALPAQAQQSVRVRGSIRSIDAASVVVATRLSGDVTVALPKDVGVMAAVPGKLADIKPGSFVGSAARTLPDGSMEALEVHVFPESMRGAGAGHTAWDLGPGTSMTNGDASLGAAIGTSAHALTVQYPDGRKTIAVPADVPVVLIVKADRAALLRGAQLVVSAAPAADGTLTAQFIIVGRNGMRPPM